MKRDTPAKANPIFTLPCAQEREIILIGGDAVTIQIYERPDDQCSAAQATFSLKDARKIGAFLLAAADARKGGKS